MSLRSVFVFGRKAPPFCPKPQAHSPRTVKKNTALMCKVGTHRLAKSWCLFRPPPSPGSSILRASVLPFPPSLTERLGMIERARMSASAPPHRPKSSTDPHQTHNIMPFPLPTYQQLGSGVRVLHVCTLLPLGNEHGITAERKRTEGNRGGEKLKIA